MPCDTDGLEVIKAAAEGAGRESVNKLASFFGAAFPFWGMRQKAVDVYVKAIENGDYSPTEKYMLIAGAKKYCRELENQMAIADIARQAAAEGTDFSMNSAVSDEFISRIMDAGKHVSDEETRLLWGNIIAGEFEAPGSTPWSVVRILSELSRKYAEIFSKLCSLQFDVLVDDGKNIEWIGKRLIIGATADTPYLTKLGISYEAMLELTQLGLINTNFASHNYQAFSAGAYHCVHLVNGKNVITVSKLRDDKLFTGHATLTDSGRCISRFAEKIENTDHIQAVKEYLNKQGDLCAETPTIKIIGEVVTGTGKECSYQRIE